jgi:hypothetical protein
MVVFLFIEVITGRIFFEAGVPPDIEATCGEIGVQPGDEKFIIAAGVGEED